MYDNSNFFKKRSYTQISQKGYHKRYCNHLKLARVKSGGTLHGKNILKSDMTELVEGEPS